MLKQLKTFAGKLLKSDSAPPPEVSTVKMEYFKEIGEEFVQHLINLCSLMPSQRVLDIGCGSGRMALPLTNYLNDEGKYDGVDIVRPSIEWCKRQITSRYPNFLFHHSDIFNEYYNPNGKIDSAEYRFSFDDNTFDVILLASVFTHMPKPEMENYISEIHRLLKPGGSCLMTFFLINHESQHNMLNQQSTLCFEEIGPKTWTANREIPNEAIGFDQDYVQNVLMTNSLSLQEPIHYGSWCGRKNFLSYQDIVIAKKSVA